MSIAYSNSLSVLPTPEKTIFFGLMPALIANINSPLETTSADVVSKGELMLAIKAGISPKKIVFSGVGKTESELLYAIDKKILLINSESESEINIIEKIAKKKILLLILELD